MVDEQLRDLARDAASGDRGAVGRLYGELEDRITRQIRKRAHGNEIAVECILTEFVDQRFAQPEFWAKAVGAESGVVAYATGAAGNFATDWMRRHPAEGVLDLGSAEDRAPRSDEPDQARPDEPLFAEVSGAEVRAWIADVDPLLRAELKVSFGVFELSTDEVDAIAARRGVEPSQVGDDLASLAAEIDNRRTETQAGATRAFVRTLSLHRRFELARAERATRSKNDSRAGWGDAQRQPSSAGDFRRLTTSELDTELDRLSGRLAEASSTLQQLGAKAGEPFSGRVDRRRIALILGVAAASAIDHELERASNTVWKRARRSADALLRAIGAEVET